MTISNTILPSSTIITFALVASMLSGCLATTGAPIDRALQTREALVVMDMQVDFLSESGAMPIAENQRKEVLAESNRMVRHFHKNQQPIYYVANTFSPEDVVGNWFRGDAAIAGSPGAALDPRLLVHGALFTKEDPDAFNNEALDAALRADGIGRLVFVGVFADQCVYWTVRGALNRGYDVSVVLEGLGTASAQDREAIVEEYKTLGVRVIRADQMASL